MSTVYGSGYVAPLPWCARCEQHHVLTAGALCPVCADDDKRAGVPR